LRVISLYGACRHSALRHFGRPAGFGAVTLEMARSEMAGYAIFHGGLAAPDG
jgi:hypothetical protein